MCIQNGGGRLQNERMGMEDGLWSKDSFYELKILLLRPKRIKELAHIHYPKGERFSSSSQAKQHPARCSAQHRVATQVFPVSALGKWLINTSSCRNIHLDSQQCSSEITSMHYFFCCSKALTRMQTSINCSRKAQRYLHKICMCWGSACSCGVLQQG